GHDDRAERQREQYEAESEHEHEHEREPEVHGVVVVELLGRVAAHVHLGVSANESMGYGLTSQLADGIDRALSIWIAHDRNHDAGDPAGLVRLDGRLPENRAARKLLLEPGHSGFHGGPTDVSGDRDLDRLGRLPRELLAEQKVALLRLEAVGQSRRPRGPRVEREHRTREGEQQACGDHKARDGAAHDPLDYRAPEAALPARPLARASEEGDAKSIHTVPEQ